MGMTAFHRGPNHQASEEQSLQTIAKALELGINFLDTAWVYQARSEDGEVVTNEELLGKAIKIHGREKFIIATKFGTLVASSVKSGGLILARRPRHLFGVWEARVHSVPAERLPHSSRYQVSR